MQRATPLRREVTVIPANPALNRYTGQAESRILNVGAYARVSTDDEDQINSFEELRSANGNFAIRSSGRS